MQPNPIIALRDEQLRAAGGAEDARPLVRLKAGELHNLATQAENLLIDAGAPFYSRGAALVRPVVDEVDAAKGRRTKVARLAPLTAETIIDWLSRVARWERFNVKAKAWLPADPPRSIAATLLSRDGEWILPRLAGVITTPTLRPDGSILSSPGYDPATRLVLMKPPTLPPMPTAPTKDDALKAIELLENLLTDFPLVDPASKSVALSAFITPVVRGAMPVAPLHALRAPVAGSGKSYLIDVAAAIATGQRCPVIAAGRTEEETEKRLASALLAGQPLISVDNVNGELAGDMLCQLIERPLVEVRPLGRSELVRIESKATTFATGNNIVLVADMVRRTLLATLDPEMERPELRRFAGDPLATVLADRGKYIAAALTICRAYIGAGCPEQCAPLASFEDWSRIVRSALVWLGRADPVASMEAAREEDPDAISLREIVGAWADVIGPNVPLTAGEIVEKANEADLIGGGDYHETPRKELAYPELHEALMSVAGDRLGLNTRKLGYWLRRKKGRVIGGYKIEAQLDGHAKQQKWQLQDLRTRP